MATKMKICHVITRMIVGGAQENTLLTIVGHVEKGHDVTLVTGPSPGPEGELLTKHELPEFSIVENRHLVREMHPYHDLAAYFSLRRFFSENRFDVVHTHSSKAGVIGRAAAMGAGVPFVTHTVHGQAFHAYEKPWRNAIYKFAERWAAKRCHKIFSVCQAMIDQCVEANIAPAEKYKVVYSGMDLEPFLTATPEAELRRQLRIPEHAPVVGAIARLFPLKGYEYFVPAAAQIAKRHPDVHFLVVGNGIMREQLEEQIESLGLSTNFTFAGLVPPHEVYRYTALMNVLVHLSLREGLPRTVVQALASGKPAVGYELDGTPEVIINGETGYVLPAEEIDGVADAVAKLLDHPDMAATMGEKGQELVKSRFDWRQMADILEAEYLGGLSKGNG